MPAGGFAVSTSATGASSPRCTPPGSSAASLCPIVRASLYLVVQLAMASLLTSGTIQNGVRKVAEMLLENYPRGEGAEVNVVSLGHSVWHSLRPGDDSPRYRSGRQAIPSAALSPASSTRARSTSRPRSLRLTPRTSASPSRTGSTTRRRTAPRGFTLRTSPRSLRRRCCRPRRTGTCSALAARRTSSSSLSCATT